ncbi:hypothetical protein PROVRETT_06555 [Providencia rettgeri DSM 1131]|nr:hypothetical protein PROVRETT_06555 [Providencia rettgeri DSM 1131]
MLMGNGRAKLESTNKVATEGGYRCPHIANIPVIRYLHAALLL